MSDGVHIDLTNPITAATPGADLGIGIVYKIVDANGDEYRSTPAVLASALVSTETVVNASGQWIRIPTLRHLLPGTVAQIEIYIGAVDLQLYRVIGNDPTVDYIDFMVQSPYIGTDMVMPTVAQALADAGPGEDIYTIGNALPNDPPPAFDCLTVWRNRAIGCRGNNIYPSQEFADGIGIQWNNTLRIEWAEGSGDITAICPIDWNYCAIFKVDAIAIISGPGPDGMGHGGYVVQTLPTKMGTANPKNVCNGDDGCYFQDVATGRLAVVTPQLNPTECAPGWFNTESATITAAMQVEAQRAVWFATDDKRIIVLDYKHRTERCPMGQVYEWDLSAFATRVVGFAITVEPIVLFADGTLAAYAEYSVSDTQVDGSSEILQDIETGDLQMFGLQGMGDIQRVQMLGEYQSPHTVTIETIPQYADSGDPITLAMNAAPEQVCDRPPNCQRIQSLRVKITEGLISAGTPPAPVYGKGFSFVGLALVVQSRGRLQDLDVGRIV